VTRRQKRALLAIVALAAIAGVAFTAANFAASSTNASNSIGAAPDYAAPTVSATTISRTASGAPTGTAGNIKQGDTYRVYANVSDSGNPASGINTVTADVSTVSGGGATAVALTACSTNCTVNGTTYGFVSADQTATNPQADGSKAYTIHTTDNASNAKTTSGFSVNVDSTAPVIAASTIASTTSGVPVAAGGFVKQGGTYKVYANITEPTSGVASATASIGNVSTATTAALTACSSNCTVGGVTYGYVSAEQTAKATLTNGSSLSYTVAATDNSGNTTTPATSFNVTVDNTQPSSGSLAATIVQTTSGTPTGPADFVKQGNTYRVYANATDAASGISSVTANVNNVTTGQTALAMTACTSNCTQGGTTYSFVSAEQTANNPLSEGTKTYTITATDNATNVRTSGTINVTADNTAPNVTAAVVSPVSGATPTGGPGFVKQGGSYRVYANLSDPSAGGQNGSGVASGSADVSNFTTGASSVALTTCSSNCTVGGTTYGYVSATQTANNPLSEGSQGFSVSTADNLGTSRTVSTFSATVDNTNPTVSASAITPVSGSTPTGAPGWVKQGGTYRIYANASDASAGINTVTADASAITTGATAVSLTTCSTNCTVGGVTYGFVSATQTAKNPLAEGLQSYTVTATDKATNTASPTFSVTVDDTAPTIGGSVISSTSSGVPVGSPGFVKASGTFRAYANASDGGSGIFTVTGNFSNVTGSSSTITFTACSTNCTVGGTTYAYVTAEQTADPALSSGSTTYSVTATDNAANATTNSAFTVVGDNTLPSIPTSTIVATSSGTPTGPAGFVKQGGSYRIYANATDSSSGVNTVSASVTNVTTGASAVALTACSANCTIGGTTYGFVSAEQTANASITDGSKSYSISATDNATNTRTSSFNVTADSTAPTIPSSAISPTSGGVPTGLPGFVKQNGTYRVYANISDGSGSGIASASADVSNVTSGATAVAMTTCSSNCTVGGVTYSHVSAEQTANSLLAEGVQGYSVSATDNLASSRTVSTFSVTVDNTAPSISASVITPTTSSVPTGGPGFVKQGGTYKVYANISDASSGIASASADVSAITTGGTSVTLTSCSSNCTVGGVTYNYSSSQQTAKNPLSEGSLGYSVTATDNAANGATNSTFSVTVDNTNPTVSASAIAPTTGPAGFVKQGGTYKIYANAADANGLSSLTASVTNVTTGASAVALTACSSSCTQGGTTYAFVSAQQTANNPLSEGSKSYSVTASDNASNSTTNSTFGVTVDNTAPSVSASVISPTSSGNPTGAPGFVKQGGTYKVYSNLSDGSGSGVASATADVHNVTTGQSAVTLTFDSTGVTVGGTTYHWISAEQTANNPLSSGSKTYTIASTDNLGTSATSSNLTVTVDNTAPTVSASVVTPTSSGTPVGAPGFVKQGGTYEIYANITDASSGVASATASVTNVTSGASSVALTACTSNCTVGGVTYGFVSAEQTADNPLSAGSKSYSVTSADNAGNSATTSTFSVTVDNTAPTVSASTISPTSSGTPSGGPGFVKQSGTYRVYANVSDASSGPDSATANLANVTAGATSVALTACSSNCTIGATTYGFVSAEQTANSSLSEGSKSYTVTPTDNAQNTGSATSFNVTVDNTAPTITNLQLLNGSGLIAGKIEQGDSIVVTYSEALHVNSMCSAWSSTGDSTNQSITADNAATVTVNDNAGSTGNDTLTVTSTSCTFHFGTIDLGNSGYDTGGGTLTYSGTGASATTINWDATNHKLTIVLGTRGGSGSRGTVTSSVTAKLTPDSAVTDLATNPLSAAFTQPTAVVEF
jgi:hypothetical protein